MTSVRKNPLAQAGAAIELHQFPTAWGLNVSPFCLKVETYCRLAGIPYTTRSTLPFKAPRGKLPFIVHGSTRVPDSGKIIRYLKSVHGDPLDAHLSQEQAAIGHMVRRTCEESLYFALVYSRWLDNRNWPKVKEAFFGKLPPMARALVPGLVRRGIRSSLIGQGYGRHAEDEIYDLGASDLSALAWQLGQRKFLVSDAVTSFDATAYAFLVNIVRAPLDTPLRKEACSHSCITGYLQRMDRVLARLGAPPARVPSWERDPAGRAIDMGQPGGAGEASAPGGCPQLQPLRSRGWENGPS